MENLSRFTFNTNPVKELLENTIDMQDAVVGMQGCVGNVTAALAEGAAYAVQYGALCLSQIVNEMNQKGISSNTLTQLNAKYQEMQAQVSNMNQQFQATTESGTNNLSTLTQTQTQIAGYASGCLQNMDFWNQLLSAWSS